MNPDPAGQIINAQNSKRFEFANKPLRRSRSQVLSIHRLPSDIILLCGNFLQREAG
jgi:hypothetical protein